MKRAGVERSYPFQAPTRAACKNAQISTAIWQPRLEYLTFYFSSIAGSKYFSNMNIDSLNYRLAKISKNAMLINNYYWIVNTLRF